jgi:hypothetical protein
MKGRGRDRGKDEDIRVDEDGVSGHRRCKAPRDSSACRRATVRWR